MASELGARYGAGVAVAYVDIYSSEMFDSHADVVRLIASRGLTLPLVSIAGKPRFAGGISTPMICEALEQLGLQPADAARN
ncbi:MAG: hypothetical protein ACYC4L_17650 [Chloroflexota bacterium]